jgi:hypothetical protein
MARSNYVAACSAPGQGSPIQGFRSGINYKIKARLCKAICYYHPQVKPSSGKAQGFAWLSESQVYIQIFS